MTQEYYTGNPDEKIYGRKSGGFKKGCLLFLIVPVLAIIAVLGYFILSPSLFPNSIKGDLLDLTYIPGKDGKTGKLWIQTDGSFSYIQKTETPGKMSMGRKGLFCKTFSYIYDPEQKKVIQKVKTKYDELPPPQKVFYKEGKVWIVSGEFGAYEPMVNIYDAESASLILDTKAFTSKYKELNSGMTSLRVEDNPKRFVITTHDGQNVIYSVDKEKIFGNEQELKKSDEKASDEVITIFMLGGEDGSGPRKKLYKVTGPYSEIVNRSVSESSLNNPSSLKFFNKAEATALTPNKVYLEGLILYDDNENVIILHQSQIGKNADRMLTCIDNSGKEKWTIPPENLFKDMAVKEEDAFSVIFFMKDKFKVERAGNVIVFKFNPSGVIGFDINSGKKLWEIEI